MALTRSTIGFGPHGPRVPSGRPGWSARTRGWGPARGGIVAWLTFALLPIGPLGCDTQPSGPSPAQKEMRIEPPELLPQAIFAPGLERDYPPVCAFLREFLDACLAGDYVAYRRMVSRYESPESRERFRAIFHALDSVRVESIDTPIPDKPDTFVVVCHIAMKEGSQISLRRGAERRVAILVFPEEQAADASSAAPETRKEFRLAPAPPKFQPRSPEDAPVADEPDANDLTPEYSWTDGIDG